MGGNGINSADTRHKPVVMIYRISKVWQISKFPLFLNKVFLHLAVSFIFQQPPTPTPAVKNTVEAIKSLIVSCHEFKGCHAV